MLISRRLVRHFLAPCVLALGCISLSLHAQQPGADQKVGKYMGAETCAGCHENPRLKADFVALTEYATWKTKDRHALAFQVLRNERSSRMVKLLTNGRRSDATAESACLSCHAIVCPEEQRGREFFTQDGVSCDGCHGPSNGWNEAHYFDKGWRTKPAAEKEKLGMFDIRNPARRTEVCASCHVGDAKANKVVTHEIYAAGHPPLPPVEMAGLGDALPRHWRLMREKPRAVQKELKFDPREREETKLVLVGAAVALRQQMTLLAAQARSASWPELAAFDCAACHHELRTPSWRQARGYEGPPGRPRIRPAILTLVRLSAPIADAGATAELKTAVARLGQACDTQPFGSGSAVADAADDVARVARQLVERLGTAHPDRALSLRLLHGLCTVKAQDCPDYDSARLVAPAALAVYRDWKDGLPARPEDQQIEKLLTALRSQCQLPLNADHDRRAKDLGDLTSWRQDEKHNLPAARIKALYEDSQRDLGKTLAGAGKFDLDAFLRDLGELDKLLP